MEKLDKSQYTKEEWRAIKEEKRKQKQATQTSAAIPIKSTPQKNNVLCMKHGTKYSCDYVNTLYNMVSRNLDLEYEFWCITDDPKGLNPNIKVIPLPPGLEGWWCKPYMFSKDLPIEGTILYMDLDVVIAGPLDKLFEYRKNTWCIIRDFTRVMRKNWNKYNSSVIRFEKGQLDYVWQDFDKNKQSIIRQFFGDQDYLYAKAKNASLWPDSWIKSWKWEIRRSKEFAPGGKRGNRKLKRIENDVQPHPDCCITVFHGDPNPHNCEDKWVVDNWQ